MNPIEILRNRAKELMTTEHEFIDSVKIEFTTGKSYGFQDGQQVGKYLPIQNKIMLYDEFSKFPTLPELAADNLFPTYYHELMHALQRRECGLILYLLALFFMRGRLEKDAREMEDQFYPQGC